MHSEVLLTNHAVMYFMKEHACRMQRLSSMIAACDTMSSTSSRDAMMMDPLHASGLWARAAPDAVPVQSPTGLSQVACHASIT